MAGGISVKMGVDVTQFKRGIKEATSTVRTLDEQLKTNEKQLKLNGDAELYMKNKSALLKAQLEAQRKIVVNTYKALEEMKSKGVDPASDAYKKLEENLAKAQGKMADIQVDIKELETGSAWAKDKAKELHGELKGIKEGVSFRNVTSGLKRITENLENAAQAAINLGKKIAGSAKDSAEWADDVLTRATQNGVDAETIQRMDNVARFIDTDVDTILGAKNRLANNKKSLGELLGLEGTDGMSLEDQFWAAGEAIMAMTDEAERADKAQDVFGRSWKELVPLFAAGREEYERYMNSQNVLTNEQVQKLGEADDEFQRMEIELQRMKNEFWAEHSQTVIDLLQWIMVNKDGLVIALGAIAGGFGLIKIGEFAANVGQVVNGFKELLKMGGGGGAGAGAGAATGGGGTALGSAGAAAGGKIGFGKLLAGAAKAVPWVAGAAVLLTPADTGSNDTRDGNGNLTSEGQFVWKNNIADWGAGAPMSGKDKEALDKVAEIFGEMARFADDTNALNAIARYRYGGTEESLIQELEALGYIRKPAEAQQGTPSVIRVDENGGMYDAAGNRVGFQMDLADTGELTEEQNNKLRNRGRRAQAQAEQEVPAGTTGFVKWAAEDSAKYAAIYGGDWGGKNSTVSQAQEQATRQQNEILAALPAGIANSISRIRVVMDGAEVGYLVAPLVSQMIARGITQ